MNLGILILSFNQSASNSLETAIEMNFQISINLVQRVAYT